MEQKEIDKLVAKLTEVAQAGEELEIFTKTEVSKIRELLALFEMLRGWGRLGKLLIWLIITAAAVKVGVDNLGMEMKR